MCVLILARDVAAASPWIVAANRDEDVARPARPPRPQVRDGVTMLSPRDERAGGTWIGVSDRGLSVAVTNRVDGDYDPARPSRGALCDRALAAGSVEEARAAVRQDVHAQPPNPFNLVVADATVAWLLSWNGRYTERALPPGVHVLSNRHDLGDLRVPELAEVPWGSDWDDLALALQRVLASHTPRDPNGFALCKHGDRYATVSSSLVRREPAGGWEFRHLQGNPCTAAWATWRLNGRGTR